MNKQKTNKSLLSLPALITLLFIFVVAFGCGCAFDLQVSKAFYASNMAINKIVGGAISNIGLTIGFFVIFTAISSFVISSYVYKDKQRWKTITTNVIGILGFVVVLVAQCFATNEWTTVFGNKTAGIVVNVVLTILIAGLAFCLSWFGLRKFEAEKTFKTMFWLIVFIVAISVLRYLLCITWSRPRPKLVFDEAAGVAYRPVWKPDWFAQFKPDSKYSSLLKSFPSGHTATAAYTIGFCIALYKMQVINNNTWSKVLLVVAIMIMVFTALGRMMAGWHFLTDISFGALMSISSFAGLSALLDKRIK